MTTYSCAKCSLPAVVKQGAVVRACACAAPIIAHLTAKATGTAVLK